MESRRPSGNDVNDTAAETAALHSGSLYLPRAIGVNDFARMRFYDFAHDCVLTEFVLKELRK